MKNNQQSYEIIQQIVKIAMEYQTKTVDDDGNINNGLNSMRLINLVLKMRQNSIDKQDIENINQSTLDG